MEREPRERRRSSRRGRRSDPRLRGLSYEERRRVYLRRRAVAVLVILVALLVIAALVGLILIPRGSETGEASPKNASNELQLEQNSSKEAEKPDVPASSNPEDSAESAEKPVAKSAGVTPTETARGEVGEIGPEPLNVLVLGVDRRPEGSSVEGSRTDTVMVARVDPQTGGIKILSIPRDLFVEVEPGVEDRINAAYSYGGVEQVTNVVEETTGISVDRYAVVDFEGFEDIVDAVGGITVEIQDKMPPGRHMEGTQTLDGEKALFYARYRGTPGGDLDRIKRQQQVVAALRQQLVSWSTVSKLPEIVEAIRGNLETDLGPAANLSLARSLLNSDGASSSSVTSFQLAGVPTTLTDGRQVLVPDPAENERILQEFRGE